MGRQAHLQVNGAAVGCWVLAGPDALACRRRPLSPRSARPRPPARFESKAGRKSKVCFTSVTISVAAKAAFLAERPGQVAIAQAAAARAAQAAADKAAKAQGKKGGKQAAAGGAENVAPAAKRGRA